jgi:flagellar motor switch protein FliM
MTDSSVGTEVPKERASADSGVRPYDFRHPSRLSKDQIGKVGYLHQTFARRMGVALAGILRGYVETSITDVAETLWSSFKESIPDPCTAFSFSAEPLNGVGVIEIEPGLALAFVDRLFGGNGSPIESNRGLTSLEDRVIRRVINSILREIETVWSPLAKLRLKTAGFASSPEHIQASGVTDSVVVLTLDVDTGNTRGNMRICYPYLVFEPLLRAITPPKERNGRSEDGEVVSGLVRQVPVPVRARLAPSMVSIRDLTELKPGDVLVLDSAVTDQVLVLVGDKPIFRGRPGRRGRNLAIKVTQVLKREG